MLPFARSKKGDSATLLFISLPLASAELPPECHPYAEPAQYPEMGYLETGLMAWGR